MLRSFHGSCLQQTFPLKYFSLCSRSKEHRYPVCLCWEPVGKKYPHVQTPVEMALGLSSDRGRYLQSTQRTGNQAERPVGVSDCGQDESLPPPVLVISALSQPSSAARSPLLFSFKA